VLDPRPWLFLDVDGVLNAYALARRGSRNAFGDFRAVQAMGFALWLSEEMGRRLAALPVDIAWSTTWSPYVDDVIVEEVGLPRGLPVAATPPEDGSVPWRTNWKLVQVRSFLAGDVRPFVWLDDDALDEPGPEGITPREWAASLPVPSLLIAPSPTTGIQPGEIDSIEAWVDRLEADAARGR
jgi:hypothetical protein